MNHRDGIAAEHHPTNAPQLATRMEGPSDVLRVGLTVGRGTAGGIARYSRELFRALSARADLRVIPIGTASAIGGLDHESSESVVVPTDLQVGDAVFMRYFIARKAHQLHLDIVHGTRHIVPRRARCPTVLTVHDLFALERRDEFPMAKRLLLPYWYRRSLRDADTLLCVSDTTRRRLAGMSGSLAVKAATVRGAVPSALLAAEPQTPTVPIGDTFALVVGDLSPRKNVDLLVRIWPAIFAATGMTLVIVGPDGWGSDSLLAAIRAPSARTWAARLEGVSDGQLRWLYERARVVLCPSVAEGWGLPVVEALAFGAPVLASRDPALAEAANGRATLLDSTDAAAWAGAIINRARSERVEFVTDAPPRTWIEVADETARTYRTLAAGDRPRRPPSA
jgi:glycosyltransferase involved in cell wall biosynthesis